MIRDKTPEEELIELLQDSRAALHKAEVRHRAAESAIRSANEKVAACEHTLYLFRVKAGLIKELSSEDPTEER